jgi:mRNA interferase RelE/StbE
VKTIIFTIQAARELDALPRQARASMSRALSEFAIAGSGDVKLLKGRDGYRLRDGSYRALFTQDANSILVVAVGRRTTTTYRR